MAREFTGTGDPARSMPLLWRREIPLEGAAGQARRGPRAALSVDSVVEAAIALADAEGLAALSMRKVSEKLGVGAMSLYTYVPGKAELVDLMFDAVLTETYGPGGLASGPWPAEMGWRDRVAQVAQDAWDTYVRHPWALRVAAWRPPMGPGVLDKYEHELSAVDGIGLDEVQMDAVVTLVNGLVDTTVGGLIEKVEVQQASGITEQQWWDATAPFLEQVFDAERFPVGARVGPVVGEALQAAYDPERSFAFGLARLLDGVEALIARGAS